MTTIQRAANIEGGANQILYSGTGVSEGPGTAGLEAAFGTQSGHMPQFVNSENLPLSSEGGQNVTKSASLIETQWKKCPGTAGLEGAFGTESGHKPLAEVPSNLLKDNKITTIQRTANIKEVANQVLHSGTGVNEGPGTAGLEGAFGTQSGYMLHLAKSENLALSSKDGRLGSNVTKSMLLPGTQIHECPGTAGLEGAFGTESGHKPIVEIPRTYASKLSTIEGGSLKSQTGETKVFTPTTNTMGASIGPGVQIVSTSGSHGTTLLEPNRESIQVSQPMVIGTTTQGLRLAETNMGVKSHNVSQVGGATSLTNISMTSTSSVGTVIFRPLDAKFGDATGFVLSTNLYCKFKLGWHTGKTKPSKNSVLEENVALPRKHNEQYAKLKVKDLDATNKKFRVGTAKIPLDEVVTQGRCEKWYPISNKKQDVIGEIHLSMDFINVLPK